MPSETVDQRPSRNVPDAHDGVQRSRGDEARIGGDGHARHARVDVGIVIDREDLGLACGHVPYPRRLVARTRDDERAVVGEVERIDLLLVAFKGVTDAFAGNIPYLRPVKFQLKIEKYSCQFTRTADRRWTRKRTRISRSSAPVARYLPSGEKQTARM